MPFFIQTPPATDIPKTQIEFVDDDLFRDQKNEESRYEILRLDENFIHNIFFKDKFFSLKNAWESKTVLLSSVAKIISDDNFKRIVAMGDKVIPLIIDEIEKKPSTLVWALNLITNSSIESNQRLTVTEACNKWVKLYRLSQINSEIRSDNAKFGGEQK
jgi:hypothetical protein